MGNLLNLILFISEITQLRHGQSHFGLVKITFLECEDRDFKWIFEELYLQILC